MNIHEGNGYAKCATYITISWSTFVVMSSTISEKILEDNKVLKHSPDTESQELTSLCYLLIIRIYNVKMILSDLILNFPSKIFQLNRDGSSWVEPVLS